MINAVGYKLDDGVDPRDERFYLDLGQMKHDGSRMTTADLIWAMNHFHLSAKMTGSRRPEAEVQKMIDDCPDQELHKYERSDSAARYRSAS